REGASNRRDSDRRPGDERPRGRRRLQPLDHPEHRLRVDRRRIRGLPPVGNEKVAHQPMSPFYERKVRIAMRKRIHVGAAIAVTLTLLTACASSRGYRRGRGGEGV